MWLRDKQSILSHELVMNGWTDRQMDLSVRLNTLHHLVGDKGCFKGSKLFLMCFVHPAEAWSWPSPELGDPELSDCWSLRTIPWKQGLKSPGLAGSISQHHPWHCTALALLPQEKALEVLFMEKMSSVGWGQLCRTLGQQVLHMWQSITHGLQVVLCTEMPWSGLFCGSLQ